MKMRITMVMYMMKATDNKQSIKVSTAGIMKMVPRGTLPMWTNLIMANTHIKHAIIKQDKVVHF